MKIIFYITVITSFLITNLYALPTDLLYKKVDEINRLKTHQFKQQTSPQTSTLEINQIVNYRGF